MRRNVVVTVGLHILISLLYRPIADNAVGILSYLREVLSINIDDTGYLVNMADLGLPILITYFLYFIGGMLLLKYTDQKNKRFKSVWYLSFILLAFSVFHAVIYTIFPESSDTVMLIEMLVPVTFSVRLALYNLLALKFEPYYLLIYFTQPLAVASISASLWLGMELKGRIMSWKRVDCSEKSRP